MSVEGTWDITLRAQQGNRPARLHLVGGDNPSGTMASDEGTAELRDYAVDGNTATWKVGITVPMPLTLAFTATVDGDTISGKAKVTAFIKIPFDGVRV
ncbi:hypothetical protein ACWZHB_12540 [Nocardia sp. FBN12]|uniref:hypothetical protein n=1 Tax=Nocardia sp. FBN12 TaxID=3419766 RepID=UPI003CFC1DBD